MTTAKPSRAPAGQTKPWTVQVFKGKDGKYRVRLKGANGERTLVSEAYATRFGARRFAHKVWEKGLQGFVLDTGEDLR